MFTPHHKFLIKCSNCTIFSFFFHFFNAALLNERGIPLRHLQPRPHRIGSRTSRLQDTSAPQNWCRSLSRITGGAVSHRNCPGSKCPGFSSITALVSKCLVRYTTFLVSKCLEIGAEVSQSVLMPKCLVAEVSDNHRIGQCAVHPSFPHTVLSEPKLGAGHQKTAWDAFGN